MHQSQILCNQVAISSGVVGYYYFTKTAKFYIFFPYSRVHQLLVDEVILDVLSKRTIQEALYSIHFDEQEQGLPANSHWRNDAKQKCLDSDPAICT